MPQDFVIGMNGKAYQGPAGTAIGSLVEITNIKDVSISMEAGEADVTTRGNSGWRATAATLRECSAEFEMLWKPTDVSFTAIKNAFLNATNLSMAFLSEESGQGPLGDFAVTNFSRNEPLEEGITVSVTVKLASFTQWIE